MVIVFFPTQLKAWVFIYIYSVSLASVNGYSLEGVMYTRFAISIKGIDTLCFSHILVLYLVFNFRGTREGSSYMFGGKKTMNYYSTILIFMNKHKLNTDHFDIGFKG